MVRREKPMHAASGQLVANLPEETLRMKVKMLRPYQAERRRVVIAHRAPGGRITVAASAFLAFPASSARPRPASRRPHAIVRGFCFAGGAVSITGQ
jgi:hypothetical protein